MTSPLQGLEPAAVWKFFGELAAIPRASKKEGKARQWVLDHAKRLGLDATSDGVGNIVVRKPARPGREAAPVTALQGHLDMVCEKNEGTPHDFDNDPIGILRDGDWLKADGTTLGADNGVGVSAALAVMESKDIVHGPLEFVFTIDEETGLTGAAEFPSGLLQAKFFLNLDGEEQDTVCIGCAGGLNTLARRKVAMQPATAPSAWRVKVAGLKGGHSGIDIHLGRGNAIRILGRVLRSALDGSQAEIAEVRGGSKRNVIPREASAILVTSRADELKKLVARVEAEARTELGSFDPGLQITLEPAEPAAQAVASADATAIATLLTGLPHGVLQMSPDVPGLVQTSTNLATVTVAGGEAEITSSQRSPLESSKQAAARMVADLCRMAGFEVEHVGGYPGWKPEPNSDLVKKVQEVHQTLFRKPTELIAVHAGLECGVIGEKYPGIQMVAFGPQIVDPHSPNERVQISSVEPFWKYLRAILESL